jgi:hypothetical protein
MTDFRRILALFAEGGVEFIVVGGVAANAHGAARATYDVDLVYRRTDQNIRRIVQVLAAHNPYPRGAPPVVPKTLKRLPSLSSSRKSKTVAEVA